MKYNNAVYFYRKDAQGNIIALLDSSGNVVVKYVYDAWGNHAVLDANGADITDVNHIGVLNPFRYRGYFYDVETGLYYLQTRYYDPEIGRFITIDGIEYLDPETINGLNLYAYCGNNPVMYTDPTGTFLIGLLLAIGGIIVGGLITGTVAAVNRSEGESFGGAFLGGFIDGAFGAFAIAVGLATGGIAGLAVTAGISFIGGMLGNAVGQAISFGNVNWKVSAIQGTMSAFSNSIAYVCWGFAGITTGNTWAKRFVDSLKLTDISVGISVFLAYYSFPNPNVLRGQLYENSRLSSSASNRIGIMFA